MTEYEKQLSKRVMEAGDKFIYRGSVYNVVKSKGCWGCVFNKDYGCGAHGTSVPLCNNIHFTKLGEQP